MPNLNAMRPKPTEEVAESQSMPATKLEANTGFRPRKTFHTWAGILGFALVWYLAAMLGLFLGGTKSVPLALWPASGVSLAILLLYGRKLWPGILLGTLAAAATVGEISGLIVGLGVGTLAESLVACYLLRYAGFRNSLDRIHDVLMFLVLAAFLATLAGTLVQWAAFLLLDENLSHAMRQLTATLLYWFARTLGMLLFAPLLLALAHTPKIYWLPRKALEVFAIFLTTIIASVGAFAWQSTTGEASYPFLIFPFVIWAALRYGSPGATTSILLVATIGFSGTLNDWGFFSSGRLQHDGVFMLQIFLAVLALTGLILTAILAERAESLATLRDSESRYRSLFDLNPHPMFVFRLQDGAIFAANEVAINKLQRNSEDLLHCTLGSLAKEDFKNEINAMIRAASAGSLHQAEIVFSLPDGGELHCACTASQVIYSGKPAGLLIAEDMTEQIQTKEALYDLEQKLTLHMYQTALGVIEWTPEFHIIEWNPAAEKIFGFTTEEAIGQYGPDLLVPPSDRELVNQVWHDLIHLKGGTSSTNYNLTKSGTQITCEWFNTPLVDRKGKVIGVESVVHDITLRERSEEALRQSEEKFRNIIESSPMGIHIFQLTDDDDLIVVGGNSAADRILGVEHAKFIGQKIEDAFPMLRSTDIPQRYKEAAKGGIAWSADQVTYVGNQLTGAYEVTAFQTAPNKVVAMLLDVTERRRAEEALRLREKAMEAITQGIVIHLNNPAQDIPIIYANPAFEQITGYALEEIIGYGCRKLYGEQTSPTDKREMDEAFLEMRSTSLNMQLYRKNGEVFDASVSISPIKDDHGRVTHFASVLSDITAIRRLESQFRQSQKMEAIGRLAGGVAHDFNNLLTAIIGYNDLVLNGLSKDSPLLDNTREIQRAAERAAALTGQLLSFSRQQPLLPQIVDINNIVSGLQKLLIRLIGEGIEIRSELSEQLAPAKCEPGQIEQIILNMAINARDAMAGHGVLTIHTGMVSINDRQAKVVSGFEPGNYVLLSISDNGCGMSRKVREHLFEPFFTTKEKGKGTGLGLATCYSIVKQNGGDIRVQSEVGQGTTFEVLLPAASHNDLLIQREETTSSNLGGNESILVVEDDPAVRPLTVSILESLGYHVLEATNGQEAIQIIQSSGKQFDLVVTDVVMPNMGGKELADWLSSRLPSVRILFTSGYIESTLNRRDIGNNEKYFLQKPFTPVILARKVRAILEENSPEYVL